MKTKTIILVVMLLAPTFLLASTYNFTRTLSLGMKGEDVRELQKILNSDTDTRVSVVGNGSLGYETDYFGPATKKALVRFQEKYKSEILSPSGLLRGTGVFGMKTRAKVITLGSVKKSVGADSVEKGDVIVMFPSRYSGKPGTLITIAGAGFTKTDNVVYFSERYAVEKAVSWNGQEITLKIPEIPKGHYKLYVNNARGESNKDAFFVVTDGVTPEPVIESVSPVKALRGDTVMVSGSGFSVANNTIRAGSNIVDGVPSLDGKSISFIVPANVLSATSSIKSSKKVAIPIWVHVINENGVSNGKSFDLEL